MDEELTGFQHRALIMMSADESGEYPKRLLYPQPGKFPKTPELRREALAGLVEMGFVETTGPVSFKITDAGRAATRAFAEVYPGLAELMPKNGEKNEPDDA